MIRIGHEIKERLGLSYVLNLLSPCSPYGAEQVRRLRFYGPQEREALEAAYQNVEAARRGLDEEPETYSRLKHLFMQLRDIRESLRRTGDSVLTEVELFEVKRFLLQLSLIVPLFEGIRAGFAGITLTEEAEALRFMDPDRRHMQGFSLHSPALTQIRAQKRAIESELRTAKESGREALLSRRAALVAREERENLHERARLTEGLRAFAPALLKNAEAIGALDFAVQRAELALARGGVRPRIVEAGVRFEGMEHPEVADALREQGRAFTRISVEARPGATVITGANMGGKSVALQTLALQVLLCHAGFFALAARAELQLFDGLWLIGGDGADARAGLSSFGAEVQALSRLLQALDGGGRHFVALDEPARGTNPREGAALVAALAKRLQGAPAVSVLATHYDGVSALASAHYQSAGLRALPNEPPGEDRLAFLAAHMDYGLLRVDNRAKTPKDALTVCRLLGLDEAVTRDMAARLGADAEGPGP